MVLLDIVRQLPDVRLVVAHVNHGIRKDATMDADLVRRVAMSHNLVYEEATLQLGSDASEERARIERYKFLRHVRKKYNARALLTAHHKDDLIETAIINMLRGTGWRGLSSLRSTDEIIRPFLTVSKADLEAYAQDHSLQWLYDSTNDQTRYLRNHVRHDITAHMPAEVRQKLYQYIVRQNELTTLIDDETAAWTTHHVAQQNHAATLPRYQFIMVPDNVAHELLQSVLRRVSGKSVPRPLAERALHFIKVAKVHKTFPINARWRLRACVYEVIVEPTPLVVS